MPQRNNKPETSKHALPNISTGTGQRIVALPITSKRQARMLLDIPLSKRTLCQLYFPGRFKGLNIVL